MDAVVSRQQFDSRRQLDAHLGDAVGNALLLGDDLDAPSEFFCFEVERTDTQPLHLGVRSAGIGIEPSLHAEGRIAWVGFNSAVAVVSLTQGSVTSITRLLSLFWRFLATTDRQASVLCETAVLAISHAGSVLWRVDTDLVRSSIVDADTVTIECDDGTVRRLDIASGRDV